MAADRSINPDAAAGALHKLDSVIAMTTRHRDAVARSGRLDLVDLEARTDDALKALHAARVALADVVAAPPPS